MIPVLGSQSAGDVSHKIGGRLPLLSARPPVTIATLKTVATCHGRVQTCGPMGACIACSVISVGGMCGRCWS